MAIAPTDMHDKIGIDPEAAGAYGAQTRLKMQQRALKQYNPGAAQFQNVDPTTAPAQPSVASSIPSSAQNAQPAGPPAPLGPAKSTPQSTPQTSQSTPQNTSRGFGPASGLGQGPGQAPASAGSRGFGASSGLGQPDQPANQPLPPSPNAWSTQSMSEAFQHLAALPNVSPVIQLYARLAAQKAQQQR